MQVLGRKDSFVDQGNSQTNHSASADPQSAKLPERVEIEKRENKQRSHFINNCVVQNIFILSQLPQNLFESSSMVLRT